MEKIPHGAWWTARHLKILFNKWSKPDSEKQIYITSMWNLKIWYKWTYLQNRNRLINIGNKLMVTKRESGGGIN